jgi:hypothetical protein
MQLTTDPSLSLLSQRIDSDLQAFLDRGGEIETVPVGAMAETGWTAKQRCNPQIHTKAMRQADEERAARKLAKSSIPTPRGTERRPVKVKAIKPPKPPAPPKPPRVRKPRPVHARTGRTIGRPRNGEGTKARAVLEMLATGNKTNREIAEVNGWDAKLTGVTIQKMCERGSVRRAGRISGPGVSHCVVWSLA